MKTKGYVESVREASRASKIIIPGQEHRITSNWPLCLTCRADVEASELKDVSRTGATIWARCHGKEDYYRVMFPFPVEGDPLEDERSNVVINRAMHDGVFFDPTKTDETQKPRIIL